MSVSETLNGAADHLQEFGWLSDGGGWCTGLGEPTCLEGAIRVVAHRDTENVLAAHTLHTAAKDAVRTHLTETRPHLINKHSGCVIPWSWNDAPNRTQAEVIEVLRAAAVIEESRETAAIIAGALQVDVVTL